MTHLNDHDVVVTGFGVVSPIGNTVEEFTKNMFAGVSGAGKIKRFDPASLPTRVASEVKNFETKFRDIKIAFALKAASDAMKMSGLTSSNLEEVKSQLSIGIGLELFALEDLIELGKKHELDFESKEILHFLNTPSDLCCHLISKEFQLNHPPLIHISACAASSDAIGSAFLQIKRKEMDMVLCGGTDSMINPMGIAGFSRIGAMTTKNETPTKASMPFNKNRDGFVIGEGAGFLVLESYKNAIARGAKIYAQISGQGNSLDAYSISDPHPEGVGALKAMKRALKSAGLEAKDISAVSAHATGTPKNDPAESAALKSLLGDRANSTPVFATKSLIGHTISAAGAIETIASIISLQNDLLHKTHNLTHDQVDPHCELDHIIGENRKIKLKHILKNSFGFGGQNACLIISKFEQ